MGIVGVFAARRAIGARCSHGRRWSGCDNRWIDVVVPMIASVRDAMCLFFVFVFRDGVSLPEWQGISRRLMEKPIMNTPRMVSLDQYLRQLSTLLCSKYVALL